MDEIFQGLLKKPRAEEVSPCQVGLSYWLVTLTNLFFNSGKYNALSGVQGTRQDIEVLP